MTGSCGKKGESASEDNTEDDAHRGREGNQAASKKDIRKTQSMVTELEEKIGGLNDTLENLTQKLQQADTKFSQQDLRLAFLEAKAKQLVTENQRLQERVDVLENQKRILNLKIDGVKEEDQENLSDIILKIAGAEGVRCQPPDIKFVYRIGRRQDRHQPLRPRPILVQFKTETVRDNIYFSRAKLRGNQEWKQVYINDDVNESTRKKRDDMRAIALLCRHKNVNCRLHSDAIVINGRKFTEHQLDNLPVGLKLEDAKTLKTEKGILFQSEHSFLSSFHEAPFRYNNEVYNTVEHGFNHGKAVQGKRPDLAKLILEAVTPQDAKRLGKLVPDNPEFNGRKKEYMEELQYEKYSQNPKLQLRLVQTGNTPLLEATVDDFFGIGRPLNVKLLQELTWTGSNYLGEILGNIRSGFAGE